MNNRISLDESKGIRFKGKKTLLKPGIEQADRGFFFGGRGVSIARGPKAF